jgi:hypothetical protein
VTSGVTVERGRTRGTICYDVTGNMVVHGVKGEEEYRQIIFPSDITAPLNVEKFHLQKRVRECEIER